MAVEVEEDDRVEQAVAEDASEASRLEIEDRLEVVKVV